MSFIALVGLIISLIMIGSLKNRVSALEKKLSEMTVRPQVQPVQAPSAVQAPAAYVAPAPIAAVPQTHYAAPARVYASRGPSADAVFIAWIKENWLLKLGALLLLIGFGWLVSYAFLNNWIGPAGRIGMGILGGGGILALGFWRMRAWVTQGAIFVVLGATVILLTIYAARTIYGFFDPFSALALMFATSALVALAGGMYNSRQLGVMSVLMAGVAPLLTNSPSDDYVTLYSYLFVVVLGSVWITVWKDFREVVAAALLVVAGYSVPVLAGAALSDRPVLLLFAYAFAAVIYLTHTAGLMRLRGNEAAPDMIIALGNAFLLAVWIIIAAPENLQSVILLAWAGVFAIGAYFVYHASGRKEALYIYAGVGLVYLATATALEFDGAALTLAYITEAAVFSFLIYALTKNVLSAERAAMTLVGPMLLSMPSITSSEWHTNIFNKHFFVLAALSGTFYLLCAAFWVPARTSGSKEAVQANWALFMMGTFYAYVLLWLSLDGAALTIVYTLAAVLVSILLFGLTRDVRIAQRGAALLVVPLILSVEHITSSAWRIGAFHQDFAALAALSAAFFALGGLYWQESTSAETKQGNGLLLVVGSFYAFVLLWLSLHAAMPQSPDIATMISLLVYTVVGIAAYVMAGEEKGVRIYGGALLAFVVGRLLIVDVWQMALTGRIITFFLVGTLLMSTAFLGKKKHVIHEDIKA